MTLNPAEMDLLGSVITGACTPDQLSVDSKWLSQDAAAYWDAIREVWHRDGPPLNPDALRAAVRRSGATEHWLGAGLVKLCERATMASVGLLAVSGVRAEWEQRQLRAAIEGLEAGGISGIPDILPQLRDIYLSSSTEGGYIQPISTLIGEFHDTIFAGDRVLAMQPTGWDVIDNAVGGIPVSLLTTVAGRPGMGKSAFLINLAINVALQGKRVCMYALEDTRLQVYLRLLSVLSGVGFEAWLRGVDPQESRQIVDTYEQVNALRIYVSDRPMSAREICDSIERENAHDPVDMAIVDHAGHVRDIIGGEHYAIISDAAHMFAEQAKISELAMVMASQLNREVEKEADKRPTMGNLRSTGVIEQVSRMVMLLMRPEYYWPDQPATANTLEVNIAKFTSGRTGTYTLSCDMSRMRVGQRCRSILDAEHAGRSSL